jgi:hypothetical protein
MAAAGGDGGAVCADAIVKVLTASHIINTRPPIRIALFASFIVSTVLSGGPPRQNHFARTARPRSRRKWSGG